MTRFEQCLAFTWLPANDGQPYHVTPRDPGGATAWGVTAAVWSGWLASHKLNAPSLRNATKANLSALIQIQYWNGVCADQLPPGVDLMVFDMGFLEGQHVAIRQLQEALPVSVDGIMGAETIAAVKRCKPAFLVGALFAGAADYYRSLADFSTFGAGWMARNERRCDVAQVMVS